MKKFLAAGIFLLILAAEFSTAAAYEIFWYDRNCGFDKFAKIVLFPLTNVWDAPYEYQLGGEGTRNFTFNSYVDDRLTKKLKKINFIRLADEIREKDDILTNNLGVLLQPFEEEKFRAEAVEELTMADMYLVPRIRENRVQEDISPRCEWDIALESWTEEKDGPDGDKTYDKKTRVEHHVIPEAKIYLRRMQVEFTGYDKDARKILSAVQHNRSHELGELSQFHTMVDDFQKAFKEARENKIKPANKKVRIGFTPIAVTGEFGDEYMSRAAGFALEEAALKKIKKARVETSAEADVDFYVRSDVTRCELIPVWHEPSYFVSTKLVDSEKKKWRDRNGGEHEMTIYHYDQEIWDYYAYWSFYWAVSANFWLVTPDNEVLISETYYKTDDKPVDAYRHAADDFCKKVDKYFSR